MTEKIYDNEPYSTSFSAVVAGSEERKDGDFDIILDRTLFFPEEGGQTADFGVLKACPNGPGYEVINVSDVKISKDGIIRHRCDRPLAAGTEVKGEIDWTHRFSNMQQHTGEHIFSGIVNKNFGYDNVGFHLSDNEVTMDYNGTFTAEELAFVERETNMAIIRNIPVKCEYPPEDVVREMNYRSKKEIEGAIRIVSIEGYDTCACCAPHVRLTGEIGLLKIISAQNYKGGTRVSILCGFRAIEEFAKLQSAAAVVSKEYSVPVSAETFKNAIDSRNNNTLKLKTRLDDLQRKVVEDQAAELDPSLENVLLFGEGVNDVLKRDILNRLVKVHPGYCCFFDGNDENGYSFIAASANNNCNGFVKLLKERFETRGGGKPAMVQGSVKASKNGILELVK